MKWSVIIPWCIAIISACFAPVLTLITTDKQLKLSERLKKDELEVQQKLKKVELHYQDQVVAYKNLVNFIFDKNRSLAEFCDSHELNTELFALIHIAKLWSTDNTAVIMDELYRQYCPKEYNTAAIGQCRVDLLKALRNELSPAYKGE